MLYFQLETSGERASYQPLVTDIMRLTGDVQAVVMAGGKVDICGN